jgi:hypothetical protein
MPKISDQFGSGVYRGASPLREGGFGNLIAFALGKAGHSRPTNQEVTIITLSHWFCVRLVKSPDYSMLDNETKSHQQKRGTMRCSDVPQNRWISLTPY